MLAKLFLAAALLVGAAVALAAQPGEIPVPKLSAHVIDQTGTLTASQRASLEAKLADFERTHGSQVVVLMVASTGGEDIFDFATRVTDQWQLGRKGVDDGVLFVIAKDQHDMRIHTGRGVQGTLTDYLSKQIVSDLVAPRFRAGDFAGGIEAGVDAIVKAIEGEQLPLAQAPPARHSASSYSNLLMLAFFLVPVIGMVLRGIFGRLFGAGIAGGLFGVIAWLFLGSLAFGVLAAIFGFVFTIAGGSGLGRGLRGGPPGWGGGFGGGGFGGGGFSGGGGTFDGGGASGKW
jgi:uncharacterized protein